MEAKKRVRIVVGMAVDVMVAVVSGRSRGRRTTPATSSQSGCKGGTGSRASACGAPVPKHQVLVEVDWPTDGYQSMPAFGQNGHGATLRSRAVLGSPVRRWPQAS